MRPHGKNHWATFKADYIQVAEIQIIVFLSVDFKLSHSQMRLHDMIYVEKSTRFVLDRCPFLLDTNFHYSKCFVGHAGADSTPHVCSDLGY